MATLKQAALRPRTSTRWSTLDRPNLYSIVAAVTLLLVGLAAIYQISYAERIFIGVHWGEKSLGGMRQQQAEEAIELWYATYEASQISFHHNDREWQVAPSQLGITVDPAEATATAFAVGREGNFLQNWGTRLGAIFGGRQAQMAAELDHAKARAFLQSVARDIDRPRKEAKLVVDAAGAVQVASPRPGETLDQEQALHMIETMPMGTRNLVLPVKVEPAVTVARDFQNPQVVEKLATSQPFTLQYENVKKTFSPAELSALLQPSGSAWPAYRMDMAPFRAAIDQMAKQINQPPVEAKLERKGSEVVVSEAKAGAAVDVEASLAKIRDQIITEERVVNLEVKVTPPTLAVAEASAIQEMARKITSQPLIVTLQGKSITITQETLAGALTIAEEAQADGQKAARLGLDDAKIGSVVERIAGTFDQPPRDAKVKFSGGRVVVLEQAKDGIKVKAAETKAKLAATLLSGKHTFEPEVEVAKGTNPLSDVEQIVIEDLLMDASTSYAGASAAKRHNVELATSRLDGILIAPGEVFSFNRALGPTRIADGYKMGWGIMVSGNEAVTVPSEAGGICQVVTTLFHAVFWSGMKVHERWPHMYWIASYGQPPRGMRGLDATVDGNTIDFRFENNTGHWVAIKAWTANSRINFELWGKDPGWKVEVDGPKIEKVVPADREIVYRDDPSMDPGEQLQVEAAMDGFLATIYRKVSKGGNVISELTVRSDYVPAHNVVLVHPRPPTATPVPEVTASPTRAATSPTAVPTQSKLPTPVGTVPPATAVPKPNPAVTPTKPR